MFRNTARAEKVSTFIIWEQWEIKHCRTIIHVNDRWVTLWWLPWDLFLLQKLWNKPVPVGKLACSIHMKAEGSIYCSDEIMLPWLHWSRKRRIHTSMTAYSNSLPCYKFFYQVTQKKPILASGHLTSKWEHIINKWNFKLYLRKRRISSTQPIQTGR